MMTGALFLLTLYLQDVLSFSAPTTGLIFGVPGIASVFAGVLAGRFINRYGTRTMLTVGLAAQGLMNVPLLLVGSGRISLVILLPTLFVAFFAHVTAIVSYMVTATSGLPDSEQGLATGLATLAQQIGITVGIPVISAVAAVRSGLLAGLHFAATLEIVVLLIGVALIWHGLRPRAETMTDAADPDPARTDADELAA
jgi:predicted MFS family arabinose efflux permease